MEAEPDPAAPAGSHPSRGPAEVPGAGVDSVTRAFLFPDDADPLPDRAEVWWATRDGAPLAALSLQVVHNLNDAPGPSGLVGHIRLAEGPGGTEVPGSTAALAALLGRACGELAARGVRRVLGPMNGSTWARYRLVTDPAPDGPPPEPPFFMEPWTPPSHLEAFRTAGFDVRTRYLSAIIRDLTRADPRREEALSGLRERGIRLAPIRMGHFEEELADLHALSVEAFSGNPLYSPQPWPVFREMYARVRPLVDPSFVRLARTEGGELKGFFFALPDPALPSRVILKTVAVTADARGTGLGPLLLDEPRRLAVDGGYEALIHALMHEENPSARISSRSARIIRRYALLEWTP